MRVYKQRERERAAESCHFRHCIHWTMEAVDSSFIFRDVFGTRQANAHSASWRMLEGITYALAFIFWSTRTCISSAETFVEWTNIPFDFWIFALNAFFMLYLAPRANLKEVALEVVPFFFSIAWSFFRYVIFLSNIWCIRMKHTDKSFVAFPFRVLGFALPFQ